MPGTSWREIDIYICMDFKSLKYRRSYIKDSAILALRRELKVSR